MSVYISGSKKGMRARDPFLVAKRKRPTVKSVARSVKRMQSRVELKHKDTSTSSDPTVAGTLTLLNDIAQGLTESTRVGDEIYATSIQFRVIMTAGSSATVTTSANSTRIYSILGSTSQCGCTHSDRLIGYYSRICYYCSLQ